MKILVVGEGGREHALAWKFAQSNIVDDVFVAPGNAGTQLEPKLTNIDINPMDIERLAEFATNRGCALTIIGPEAPLVAGISDHFQSLGLACLGPSKGAAKLEGSKSFAKEFLCRHQIPTAFYRSFNQVEPALQFIRETGAPIVVKADGLAAGKGVTVATTLEEAESAVRDMLSDNKFGDAGSKVIVEEFLEGEEASFIVMVDGKNILPMATSQDHKRIGDGDTGPNTGGMGAYSPAPVVTRHIHKRIMEEIITPTVQGMAAEGNHYVGILYAGLMIDSTGKPHVIEYNCRFGDPETQPILHRLKSDLVELCEAALAGSLNQVVAEWDPRPAVAVVLANSGYPGTYVKGQPIEGLSTSSVVNTKVFHSGTRFCDGKVITDGGRVLCVSAIGETIQSAIKSAYRRVDQISWKNMACRRDIGWRALKP